MNTDVAKMMIEAETHRDGKSIDFIHGNAPCRMGDIPAWIEQIRKNLRAMKSICEADDFDEDALPGLIIHLTEFPLALIDNLVEVLKESFPEESHFKDLHYEGEEEKPERMKKLREEISYLDALRGIDEKEGGRSMATDVEDVIKYGKGYLQEAGEYLALIYEISTGDGPIRYPSPTVDAYETLAKNALENIREVIGLMEKRETVAGEGATGQELPATDTGAHEEAGA